MKDFNWKEFKRGNIAVHCDTEEKANNFLGECIKNGIDKWCSGSELSSHNNWVNKENTYYSLASYGFGFSSKQWHEEEGYKIIEWRGDNSMKLNVLKDKVVELETTLSELKAEIEKKENEIKAKKIEKIWKPKRGDTYCYLYSDGDIAIAKWNDKTIDNSHYNTGNCFKTKELAIKERDKRILLTEIERWALEHNEEEIDWWNNEMQTKYCICYDVSENIIHYGYSYALIRSQLPYFTSPDLVSQAIEIFGDRLKELVFTK